MKVPPGLCEEQIEAICEAFNLSDTDHSGSIDYHGLKAATRTLSYLAASAEKHSVGMFTMEELKKMITDIDAEGPGSIEFPEFLEMM